MLRYKIFLAHKASKQASINKFLSFTEVVVPQYLQSIRMLSPASNLALDLLFVPQKVLEGVRISFSQKQHGHRVHCHLHNTVVGTVQVYSVQTVLYT